MNLGSRGFCTDHDFDLQLVTELVEFDKIGYNLRTGYT